MKVGDLVKQSAHINQGPRNWSLDCDPDKTGLITASWGENPGPWSENRVIVLWNNGVSTADLASRLEVVSESRRFGQT